MIQSTQSLDNHFYSAREVCCLPALNTECSIAGTGVHSPPLQRETHARAHRPDNGDSN